MKKFALLTIALTFGIICFSQDFNDLHFGTDSTLDVMTWNIENFPKNGQTTAELVGRIIEAADADIIALQEISDTIIFNQILNSIEGYRGYFQSDWYGGLGYVFKEDAIKIRDAYEIYLTEEYWRPFPRSPLVLEVTFMYEDFILINNHLKCCGDGTLDPSDPWDEETRRRDACDLLEQYISDYFPDDNVILLGDLNDKLTDLAADNVFNIFLNNPDEYLFADMDIAEGVFSDWSFPNWPSHIDHLLITDNLFDEMENDGSTILTIKPEKYMDGGWWEYDNNISDHRPVGLKIKTHASLGIAGHGNSNIRFSAAPNPFQNIARFTTDPFEEKASIEIVDVNGKRIKTIPVTPGKSSVSWDAVDLPAGVYSARLISNVELKATIKLIKGG